MNLGTYSVYAVTKLSVTHWVAEIWIHTQVGLTCISRRSNSAIDALRQLLQAIDELDPVEAKIEEGEA